MARHMVARYGMSERIGLVAVGDADGQVTGRMFPSFNNGQCSDSTAQLIDEEVRRLLAEANDRVTQTLDERRALLKRIAQRLVQREVLDHDALAQLIADQHADSSARADTADVANHVADAGVVLPALAASIGE